MNCKINTEKIILGDYPEAAKDSGGEVMETETKYDTMRREFIICANRKEASEAFPWARVIAPDEAGFGFWAFQSVQDFGSWRRNDTL